MSSPTNSSNDDTPPKDGAVINEKDVPSHHESPGYFTAEKSTAAEKKLLWKIDLHVLPILWVLYMFAFLDRVNIGNAKIQGLTKDLHMTGTQYNVASMILFVPYILLEVPSNIIIKKIAPSVWLSGLMFFWGITTMCQGFVKSYAELLVCRVFLGIFEAGVFPGCAYLIGMYFKRFELQKRLVFFFSSSLVAGAFGGVGLDSNLVQTLTDAVIAPCFCTCQNERISGIQRLEMVSWLSIFCFSPLTTSRIFIIEGLATVAVSIAAFFLIADWPEDAKFLNQEEKELVAHRLAMDGNSGIARMDRLDKHAARRIFRDWKIWCA
jgi:MFS family permease